MPEKSCTDCYETDLMKCAACARNPKGVEIDPVKKTMPDIKEKLVELLRGIQYLGGLEEKIADHLIANGVTIQRWISVEERLPNAIEWVLCAHADGFIEVLRYDHIMDDWDTTVNHRCRSRESVTHWMPLPEPLKGK